MKDSLVNLWENKHIKWIPIRRKSHSKSSGLNGEVEVHTYCPAQCGSTDTWKMAQQRGFQIPQLELHPTENVSLCMGVWSGNGGKMVKIQRNMELFLTWNKSWSSLTEVLQKCIWNQQKAMTNHGIDVSHSWNGMERWDTLCFNEINRI